MQAKEISKEGIREMVERANQKEDYLASIEDPSFQEKMMIESMAAKNSELRFYQWVLQQVRKDSI